MVRLKDVAERLGVSVATVSKALNGMPGISEETIRLVKETARDMRYLPNISARALKTNRSFNIGVLLFVRDVSPLAHEHISRVLGAIQREAELKRYDVTLISRYVVEVAGSYLNHCRSRNYDGVIILSGSYDEQTLQELIDSELPLVTIDAFFPGRSGIQSDNAGAMRELTAHLLKLGHRRIAFIHGEETRLTQERIDGYREALLKAGIKPRPEYLRAGLFHDPETSARETSALLSLPEPPTCILYPDDFSLLGGRSELDQRGLMIPEDISIAGFDGILLSQAMHPKVCTMEQDTRAMGRGAFELLLRAIEAPEQFVPEHRLLPCRLLAGQSAGPLS